MNNTNCESCAHKKYLYSRRLHEYVLSCELTECNYLRTDNPYKGRGTDDRLADITKRIIKAEDI